MRKCPRTNCGRECGHSFVTVQGHGLRVNLDWTRNDCGHGYARGLDMATDWTRTDRGCGHESGTCLGQFTIFPRLFRGRRILSWLRGQACLVQNVVGRELSLLAGANRVMAYRGECEHVHHPGQGLRIRPADFIC